jgi:hypothetical protein
LCVPLPQRRRALPPAWSRRRTPASLPWHSETEAPRTAGASNTSGSRSMLDFSICLIASSIAVNSMGVTMTGGCDTRGVQPGLCERNLKFSIDLSTYSAYGEHVFISTETIDTRGRFAQGNRNLSSIKIRKPDSRFRCRRSSRPARGREMCRPTARMAASCALDQESVAWRVVAAEVPGGAQRVTLISSPFRVQSAPTRRGAGA